MSLIRRYVRWLHTQWPAGTVEKLPQADADGATNVAGVYIVGDLTGVPLLKFAADGGAEAVRHIVRDPAFIRRHTDDPAVLDLAIVGGGVSGFAAALEARREGLRFEVFEATEPFSTIVNFPQGKPIYTYPTEMVPAGDLQFHEKSAVKEGLVEDLLEQTSDASVPVRAERVERIERSAGGLIVHGAGGEPVRANRVIVGIGRSGNFRTLGVPGETLDKVYNRLHDPTEFCDRDVLVIGGGDSALEAAIQLATCGANVTLSYRKDSFARPKPSNIENLNALTAGPRAGALRIMLSSRVNEIRDREVSIAGADGREQTLPNDVVFSMIGREPPLDFFRRSGVRIRGEWRTWTWVGCILFFLFCVFLYHWKSNLGIPVQAWFKARHWFPFNLTDPTDRSGLMGTIRLSMKSPSFYYSLAYCLCVVGFGVRRIRRRRTPYVTVQTITLAVIQCVPLFLLPYILLPWAGHNGWFDAGVGKSVADALFPATEWSTHGREYWRSVGFILAWPLMFWNVFTHQPIWAWLVIGSLQTFVIIPFIVWRWGKGAYCGWICSCGALAETMGDGHRHKMPHGPVWNRVNLIGQVLLAIAIVLLVLRVVSWITEGPGWTDSAYNVLLSGRREDGVEIGGIMRFLNYAWVDDLLFAGIFGVCFYFWYSGRVWCRFACPLAALMHIYARFSRFRILADKKKCISCNVCTAVCHQGIDIMNFANKGLPMEDPQCVRCSACVQMCPTGVLRFGQVDRKTGEPIAADPAWLRASPVQISEPAKR